MRPTFPTHRRGCPEIQRRAVCPAGPVGVHVARDRRRGFETSDGRDHRLERGSEVRVFIRLVRASHQHQRVEVGELVLVHALHVVVVHVVVGVVTIACRLLALLALVLVGVVVGVGGHATRGFRASHLRPNSRRGYRLRSYNFFTDGRQRSGAENLTRGIQRPQREVQRQRPRLRVGLFCVGALSLVPVSVGSACVLAPYGCALHLHQRPRLGPHHDPPRNHRVALVRRVQLPVPR